VVLSPERKQWDLGVYGHNDKIHANVSANDNVKQIKINY